MNADNAAIGSLLFGKDIGGAIGGLFGSDDKEQEYRRQKEFATQGITWKVEDAKRAGIHPLYALGASTTSYAPQSVGGDSGSYSGMGQDISRAIDATSTEPQRLTAYTQKLQSLNLEGIQLDNALKLANLRKAQQADNPPFPGSSYLIDGQTQSGPAGFYAKDFGRTPASSSKPNQEPFAITDTGWARTSTPGGLAPVPSNDVKQRIEDQFIPELQWAIRNNLMPSISADAARQAAPPRSALPKGATDWYFDVFMQEYRPMGGKYGKPRGFNPFNW